MSELESALMSLSRSSWTAINVLHGDTDWTTQETRDHLENCPIREHYRDLATSASLVKKAWNEASKRFKEQMFAASMKEE